MPYLNDHYFYLEDDEFWKAFAQLDSFQGEYSQWQTPCAQKEHTDEFGDHIKRNETYFKLQVGGAFDAVIKLSRRSMDKLLFVVVQRSPLLRHFADELI